MSGERTDGQKTAEAVKAKQLLDKVEAKEKVIDLEISEPEVSEEIEVSHSTHSKDIDPLAAVWSFDESSLPERSLEKQLTRVLIYLAIGLAVWQCVISLYAA